MHIAEQVAENTACFREYGLTPIQLLSKERLLGPEFTAVHAIHINADEIAMLAEANATICSCPTTERNLGDGILAADRVMTAGIHVALGSDSQAQIDPLEDARELDYHLRLELQQRAILDQIGEQPLGFAAFRLCNGSWRAFSRTARRRVGTRVIRRFLHRGSERRLHRRSFRQRTCCRSSSFPSTGRPFAMLLSMEDSSFATGSIFSRRRSSLVTKRFIRRCGRTPIWAAHVYETGG